MPKFTEQFLKTLTQVKKESLIRLGIAAASVLSLGIITYFAEDSNFDAQAQTLPPVPTIGGTIPEGTPTPLSTPTEVATATPTVTVTPTGAEHSGQLISVIDVHAVDANDLFINAPIVLTHPDGRVELIAGIQGYGFAEKDLPTVFEVGPQVFASYGITDTNTAISGYAGPESIAGHNIQFAPSIYANQVLVRPDTLTLIIGEEPDPTARIVTQYIEQEQLTASGLTGLPTFTILQRRTEEGVMYAISTGDDQVVLDDEGGTGQIDLSSPRQPGMLAAAAESDTNTFTISTAGLSAPLEVKLTNEGVHVQAELPVSVEHRFAVSTSGEIVVFDSSGAEVARTADNNGDGVVNQQEIMSAIVPEELIPVPTVPADPTTEPGPGEGEFVEIFLPSIQR